MTALDANVQMLASSSDSSDSEAALRLVLETYGAELHGFLRAGLRDEIHAAEAYAQLCEDIWRGLPSYRGEASVRTWAYRLARHAAFRLRVRDPRRREASLSEARTSQLVFRAATSNQRAESRRALYARLREELSDEERELLLLRVDRALAWEDIARIVDDGASAASSEAIAKRSAALRKKFERIKEHLRVRLREEAAEAAEA
jgi:RNA polymerase sigma-70 factor, ECF subfamily